MVEPQFERKLAALFAADVVAYSRLMEADEEGTFARWSDHLRAVINPKIEEHGGRIVKTAGDGMLGEFPSPLEAVRCAVEIQRLMIDRNADVLAERRISLRIGINIGDVIVQGRDLFGDGVNIAARLEGLAEPGGICISRSVRDQVRGRLSYPFQDIGEQVVKNIARPVRVYSLPAEAIATIVRPSAPRRRSRRRHWQAVAAAAALVTVSSGAGVWLLERSSGHSAGTAPRLSIVVLPFSNLSGDPGQEYLSDVVTEEVTTRLARVPESFVIARSTAFTYKGKPVNAQDIGRELGVRYVLEGSVQASGARLRVNVQLIDAARNAHVWSDIFDEDRGNFLQMQDELVSRLVRPIGLKLVAAEGSRAEIAPSGNMKAEDLAWQCAASAMRVEAKLSDAAFHACDEALQLDPENCLALSLLSHRSAMRVFSFASRNRQADIEHADELASAALAKAPDFHMARAAKADALLLKGRYDDAIEMYQHVLRTSPSFVDAYTGLATAYNYVGEPELANAALDKALRISPNDPSTANFYLAKYVAFGIMGDWEQALLWERRHEAALPNNPFRGFLAAALLALSGREEEARAALQSYLSRPNAPVRTVGQWERVRIPTNVSNPRYLAWRENFVRGLLKAGLPEN